jgi:hypothetical protein
MLKLLTGLISGLFGGLAIANNIPITFYETQPGQEQIRYTAYFVLDYFDDETGVLCRTFVTPGDERLPASEKKDYKKVAKRLFKNTEHVYAVAETYFYNWSTSPVSFEPLLFSWKGVIDETPFSISDYEISVAPQSHDITPPIVKQAFYLKKEFDIEFSLKINDKEHQIKGKAKRLTETQLRSLINSGRPSR